MHIAKMQLQNVESYKVETVNGGGVGGQKSQKLVIVICKQPLIINESIPSICSL